MTKPSIWEFMIQISVMDSTIQETRENPHGTLKSNYQHRFSVNVWFGVIGDQLTGPYIFPQRLTVGIYANILQDELPALLDNVPLQTRRQLYYQLHGALFHLSQLVRQ
jgi:hypothetical protein